jgi:outer membrane lipopolysaccharide assembly protein LptE/RlpB
MNPKHLGGCGHHLRVSIVVCVPTFMFSLNSSRPYGEYNWKTQPMLVTLATLQKV